jgi:hypothetical protein
MFWIQDKRIMSAQGFVILILISLALLATHGQARELFEIIFTPCQDTFLYGTEVVLRFQVKNLTNDTLKLWGIHWTDYVHVIEKGLGSPIEWDETNRMHSTYAIIKPNHEIKVLRSYFVSRPLNTSHIEDDPIKNGYYPLGTFYAYAGVMGINSVTEERQEKVVECQFEVVLPQGTEKDVLELFHSAGMAVRNKDYKQAIDINRGIVEKYPESGYIHMVVHSLMGTFGLEYGTWESVNYKYEWANWYLQRYPDFYGEALNKSLGVLAMYYMVKNERQGLIQRLKELNQQFPGTRMEEINKSMISEYEEMSDAEFNKAHKLKR